MYKEFFHLTRAPFELSPDPSFLFHTPRHNEALASIYYGVRRHKGFVVLTGEVGTGKTLLLRCLLRMLPSTQVAFAYVFNPLLTPVQFLQYITTDLGLSPRVGKNELLHQLNSYLISRHQKGLTTLLVVDEAHHLDIEVLEEIRLLTNLETEQKLLQIVLAGQPELDAKLDSPELRQLKQRIALRCWLEPMSREEVGGYVRRRLEVAGANANADTIFPSETLDLICRYSCGVPRLVNTLCENALIAAYAHQTATVTGATIEEVARDFRLTTVTPNLAAQASSPNDRKVMLEMLLRLLQSPQPSADPGRDESKVRAHLI